MGTTLSGALYLPPEVQLALSSASGSSGGPSVGSAASLPAVVIDERPGPAVESAELSRLVPLAEVLRDQIPDVEPEPVSWQPVPEVEMATADGEVTSITINGPTVFGRGDADVVLHDPEVSRRHVLLDVRDGDLRLADLGSSMAPWSTTTRFGRR